MKGNQSVFKSCFILFFISALLIAGTQIYKTYYNKFEQYQNQLTRGYEK